MSSIVEQAIQNLSKGGTDYGLYEKRNNDGSYSSTDRVGQVVQQATADYQSGAKTAPQSKLQSNAQLVLDSNPGFVRYDTKVSFGSREFDKEAFNLAAQKQKDWWENTGSKGKRYGYDMTDPEDIQRAQEGRYSVAYEKSFGDDEYSQWLLSKGQASGGYFESKYYKEAYDSVMLERAKQEGVRNFNQAVVKELLATAADAENPTAEEIALAADRVKKTNPSFTNIGIADFGEDEADGNFATLHLDDVQDEYMAMWGKKRFQESVDQRRRTEQRNARIEAAVAASGYDATMENGTGLAYDSKGRKQYEANQKKKVAATDAIVAELRAEGLATEEIRQYLAEDGRLSYDESTEKATIDAQTKAEKAAMDNSVLGSIFSDTRRGSRMSKAEESTTGYIPATALDVTTSLLQKAKDAANNRKVWENSPIAQSAEWVAANTLTKEELTEVKNIMANAREAFILQGYSPFEIDNFFRRNDLGEYLDPVAASNNYITYTLGEWGYSDIEIQAVIDGLTDEDYETISKDMFLCDYVDTSTTDQIGYTMAAIPAIAAYRMVGDAVGFFDMVTAGNREELWGAIQWLNDRAAYWTAIGTNGNHEFLSKTAEYGSEIVRLLAMQGVGQLAGAAVTGVSAASKGTAWLTKAVWATESVPFVASAMGGYYTEAKGQGASTADATKYAVVAGAVEGLLEKLSMGEFVKGHFGSNLIGKKLMNGNTSGMVKQLFSRYGAQLADVLASSVGEGLEEGASYVASSLMRQSTWDEDYAMTGQEFGQNFLGGLIIGGILGGLSAPADSQRYKYAMDIYNSTGSYTMNMDSLYAASYYETLPEGQRLALKEKFDSGEIVADSSTRKAAIQAEGELANMDKEIAAKHKALESAKADGENKTNLAQEKIANIDQRIAAYQDADLVKKARKITELLQQRQAAEKAYKTVLSETEKKTQQAEADYIAIKNKRTEKSVALTETIANYQTAKYFTDFYGIPQKPAQNAPAGGQVAMPITNTTDMANVAQNPIDTVKTEAVEAVEPAGVDGAALGIVNPELQETVTGFKRLARKAKQAFISSFAEGERFSKLQSKINKGSVTMEDSAQLLRNAGGTVDYIMEDDLVDLNRKSMGRESYATVMTPPEGIDFDVAQDYLLNLHNIDRMSAAEAKAVMANEDGSVRTSEQSKQIVREMEAKYPELANWNAKRRQWWNAFGKEWFVNSGLVSQTDWEKWQKAFPNYVPTFRTKYDNGLSSSSIYSTTVDVHGKVKHLVGGTSEVVDIRDGFARYINSIVRATAKNDVVLNLYNFAQQHPNAAAPYAQILDAESKVGDTVTPDGLADSLDTDAFNEVVKGRYILKGKVDGEAVSMAVSKDIYEAVADLFGRTYNPGVETFMNIGKAITTPVKMGITTYNPFFAIRNFLRDTQTAYINDDSINPATFTKSLIDAAVDIHNNSEDFQRFKAYGGDRTGFYSSTAGFVESAGLNADESKVKKWFKQFGKGVSAAGEYTETLNRYATFKRYLDRNGRTDDNYRKAVQAAAEGTTNFSRSGAATKVADAWCLYLNANVQGLDKMARQFTSRDTALKSLGKTAGIAIASVIVKHLTGNDENEHYQNLSNYIKDNNFVIPNYFGEKDDSGYPTSFIVIPKSQGYGAIIAAFERTATMFDEDKEFGEAYDGYLDTLAGALPVNPSTPFSAYKQAIKNESWSGATIEPSRMESEPVTERYDSETSTISINISELLNRMGVEFSPMKVQYVLEQKTGIIGDVVLPATYVQNYDNYGEEEQKYNAQSAAKSVADPFKNQFVKDPLYSNDIVGNFYDELDEMEQLSKQAKSDRQSAGIDTKSDAEKAYSRWNDMSWWLTDSYKQERAVMASEPNTPKRDEKIRAIRKERVDVVKAFMDNPDTYKIPK